MVLEILLKPSVGLPLSFILCYLFYRYLAAGPRLPDLPRIGLKEDEWFAKTRCLVRNSRNYRDAVLDAYENYSQKGRSCIISCFNSELIVLPTTSTEWLINQTDQVLNSVATHVDLLQTDYTFTDPNTCRFPHHTQVIKTDLTRQLGNLTMDIMDELAAGFDETWGLDTSEWKDIGVFENMMQIVARTSNRVFVGRPLCRDKTYLRYAAAFAQDVPLASNILRLFPKTIRPIVAPLVTIPNRYHAHQMQKYLEPEIKTRLSLMEQRANDPERKAPETAPNDFLQWSMNYAKNHLADQPKELSPRNLVGRLLALNFAAIHTSTFSITNAIFDLVSSDASLGYLDQIREEAAAVLAEDNGVWTKRGLARMHKVDSTLRESLRVSSFLTTGLARKVSTKDGLTTPDGVHCPYGSWVAIPVYGIHNDDTVYSEASKFDAFRYVREREALEGLNAEGLLKKANCAAVSTSAEFQAFGHGRHACPGRFFAANELKLLLAYMVLNYDIEMLKKRPQGVWLANFILPPMKATIRVRRRKMR